MTKKKKKDNLNKFKTTEDRVQQVNFIKNKLENLQLDERNTEIEELFKIMQRYIETGESNSGKMPLTGSNKDIQYIFTNRKCVQCQVNLLVRQ